MFPPAIAIHRSPNPFGPAQILKFRTCWPARIHTVELRRYRPRSTGCSRRMPNPDARLNPTKFPCDPEVGACIDSWGSLACTPLLERMRGV